MTRAAWAEHEFGRAELGDVRRTRRLVEVASAMADRSSTSLSEMYETWSDQKAGYRFYSNEAVRPEQILRGHVEATKERMAQERVVLAVQDTTTLNYSHHPATIGLGALNTAEQRGLLMHTTLTVTPEGESLGLLAQEVWAREPATVGKRTTRKTRAIADKESQKWLTSLDAVIRAKAQCPDTHLVSVGDREADVYDLFLVERPVGVDLLVRAAWNRRVAGPQPHLWAALAGAPIVATRSVPVPRRPGAPTRTATVALHVQTVTLQPPRHRDAEHLSPVTVTAVWVIETDPPTGVAPIEWMLLTTLPVTTARQANRVVDWYCRRWDIEVWHTILKSGCKVEDRQLDTAQRLHRCLAVASVVAWRILLATRLARTDPDLPCTVLLSTLEWQALACRSLNTPVPPTHPPPLRQAVRWIARLGGFIGRNSDGDPGPTTLWRGFLALAEITSIFRILTRPHPFPSSG
jgi:hypothetical protein